MGPHEVEILTTVSQKSLLTTVKIMNFDTKCQKSVLSIKFWRALANDTLRSEFGLLVDNLLKFNI